MNKEAQELLDLIDHWYFSDDEYRLAVDKWVEQKKKEWQESGALKMLNYCRKISDGSISPMYLQSEKEFEQEFLEGSGIRP